MTNKGNQLKRYVVLDSSYSCRENIGWIEGTDDNEIKDTIRKIFVANYGDSNTYKQFCILEEISLKLNKDKIDAKYCDGMNWMGNLRKVKLKDIEEGRKNREELLSILLNKKLTDAKRKKSLSAYVKKISKSSDSK